MNLLVKIQNDQRVTSYLWLKGFTQKQANWLYVNYTEKKNLSKRLYRRYDSTPRSTSENVLVFPCLGLGKITPLSLHGTHNCHWNTFLKSTSSSLTTKLSHFAIMMQQSRWIFFFPEGQSLPQPEDITPSPAKVNYPGHLYLPTSPSTFRATKPVASSENKRPQFKRQTL